MRINRMLATALIAVATATMAPAAITPQSAGGDPRVRIVRYDPNEVVVVEGVPNYQMMIEFAPEERIENVSIGDSLGWQVTPNRKATLLFLKPIERDARTNMTVVTNLRRYMFDLSVRAPRKGVPAKLYNLRFDYPEPFVAVVEPPPAPPPGPVIANDAYTYDGAATLLPSRVFDDGQSTYFSFPAGADYPAIFIGGSDRKDERLAEISSRDGYLVVGSLARSFMLRRGKEVTRIINNGYREPDPGPLAPQPAKSKSRRSAK